MRISTALFINANLLALVTVSFVLSIHLLVLGWHSFPTHAQNIRMISEFGGSLTLNNYNSDINSGDEKRWQAFTAFGVLLVIAALG